MTRFLAMIMVADYFVYQNIFCLSFLINGYCITGTIECLSALWLKRGGLHKRITWICCRGIPNLRMRLRNYCVERPFCKPKFGWDVGSNDKTTIRFFFDEVSINLDAFYTFMLNCIISNTNSWFIITIKIIGFSHFTLFHSSEFSFDTGPCNYILFLPLQVTKFSPKNMWYLEVNLLLVTEPA